jgi:hypothetical protein
MSRCCEAGAAEPLFDAGTSREPVGADFAPVTRGFEEDAHLFEHMLGGKDPAWFA